MQSRGLVCFSIVDLDHFKKLIDLYLRTKLVTWVLAASGAMMASGHSTFSR